MDDKKTRRELLEDVITTRSLDNIFNMEWSINKIQGFGEITILKFDYPRYDSKPYCVWFTAFNTHGQYQINYECLNPKTKLVSYKKCRMFMENAPIGEIGASIVEFVMQHHSK